MANFWEGVQDFGGGVFNTVDDIVDSIGTNAQASALNNMATAQYNQTMVNLAAQKFASDRAAEKRRDDLIKNILYFGLSIGSLALLIYLVIYAKKSLK